MYCSKCGAKIPEGSAFCSVCGTSISGDRPKDQNVASDWVSVTSFIILGVILVIIGIFLPWMGVLGINTYSGPVVLMGAVLSLAALILARSGATGRWSVVMLLLGGLLLVLVFQAMFETSHHHITIGAGLYIAMVGTLAIAAGSIMEFVSSKNASVQRSETSSPSQGKEFVVRKNVPVQGSKTISPNPTNVEDELKKLKQLRDSGALTAAEYDEQRKILLEKL